MRNASLLTTSLVILVGALATARGEDNLKTERFDRDPGWDSHNNWTLDRKPVTVTQDFGYSETNHARGKSVGEVGGGIVRSSRTAFYLKPLGRVMTLDEPLSTTGQFVVTESDGLSSLFFGFCNSETVDVPYPRNWLVITLNGESNGCEVGVGYISNRGNGDGKRATGVGPKGAAVRDFNRIPDGTVYTFDLRYDPKANDGNGQILFTLGGDGPFTAKDVVVNVHPEYRQGMQFDSFGFCNAKAEPGSTLGVFVDDMTLNNESLTFDEDPHWMGQNNRVTYEDSFKRGAHDFGYQPDSNFAGGETGEMGGVLFSDNGGYYGVDVGRLTLDDRLVASGKMALTERASEAGFYLGWFNSKERGYPPKNLLGVFAEGPNSTGSMFRPIYASSDPKLADTLKYTTKIDSFGKTYEWRIEYDPKAADGKGELKVSLGGETAALTLTAEARQQNAEFDRFGLAVYEGGGQWSKVFFDDLEFTVDDDPARADNASKPGVVHVVVFSNFEGSLLDARPAIRWFDECTAAHPAIVWTHMYNPIYLVADSPEMRKAEATISPYLRDLQSRDKAEIGLHLHLYYDLVERLGVSARGYPYASDTSPGCDDQREPAADRGQGYDVLMTGYTADEQAALLDASLKTFVDHNFERPTAFCAGYSAADPNLQAVLGEKGFRVSFSAQTIPPAHYGTCWERLLKWSGQITPLTIPYRISRNSILPPPHTDDDYLDLVEVPLNMGVDTNDLYLSNSRVSRDDMFDRHYTAAMHSGQETAVCIGVHAEVIAGETWGKGPVWEVVDRFLTHVERRASEGGAEIRYSTVSDVAARFRDNKSSNGVPNE